MLSWPFAEAIDHWILWNSANIEVIWEFLSQSCSTTPAAVKKITPNYFVFCGLFVYTLGDQHKCTEVNGKMKSAFDHINFASFIYTTSHISPVATYMTTCGLANVEVIQMSWKEIWRKWEECRKPCGRTSLVLASFRGKKVATDLEGRGGWGTWWRDCEGVPER